MKNKETMLPGIYHGMDDETYHGSVGISKSGLMLFEKNPMKYHWQYILGNKQKGKKHFAVGKGFHMAALEPDKFALQYTVGPDINKNTKAWKAFIAENADKEVLSVSDYDQIMGMAESVRSHPIAANILSTGHAEVSIYAECPFTGELVKVRPDWWSGDIIADLKSTTDASPDKFFRDMYTFTYHVQSSMYPEVANWLPDLHINDFVFIVTEKEPPYATAVYRASEEDKRIGYQRFRRNLDRYSTIKAKGIWPTYNDGMIIDTELPMYAKRQEEQMDMVAYHDGGSF